MGEGAGGAVEEPAPSPPLIRRGLAREPYGYTLTRPSPAQTPARAE